MAYPFQMRKGEMKIEIALDTFNCVKTLFGFESEDASEIFDIKNKKHGKKKIR